MMDRIKNMEVLILISVKKYAGFFFFSLKNVLVMEMFTCQWTICLILDGTYVISVMP